MRNNKGQNLVEYILLVAAVVLVLIVFLRRHGPMEGSLNRTLYSIDDTLNALNAEIGLNGTAGVGINSK